MPDSGEKTVTEWRFLGVDHEDGDEVVEVLVVPTTDKTRFAARCTTERLANAQGDVPYDALRVESRQVTYGPWKDVSDV